jgi:penicillin-binding protein 1A
LEVVRVKSAERWFAMAGVAALSVVAAAGLALAIYAAWLFHDLPDARQLAEYRPPVATRVFAWDGTLIGEFSTERRIFTPYDQIPPMVVEAFLAAEDKNFFQHGGVDVAGMGRAMTRNAMNMARGRRLEGGSTITQQVAKNILLNRKQTMGRKLREAILARRLEATLSKEQILELYLNEIFLGYRSFGVASASFNYFGKPLDQLTVAEAAYLAALPKGPNNYHPILHKAAAMGRRNWIIDQMVGMRWVSRADAEKAKAEDLKVQLAPERAKYKDADFFVEEVRRNALNIKDLGDDLTRGGYYIRTTLDPRLQTAARVALMNGLEHYDRRHGWRGALTNIPIAPGWEKIATAKSPPSERRAWRAALVESITGDTVRVRLALGGGGLLERADATWARAGKGLHVGDLIFVEPTQAGGYGLRQVPLVNGAIVAIDPWTGRVLAMVGGYSYSISTFNRATQAMRQPGSSFKPFVYATALESGKYTPASVVPDTAITLKGANGENWTPENYEGGSMGMLPFRKGLELSRNQMTVHIAMNTGMNAIVENAKKYGIVDKMDPVLSMALGAGETTPFRLTGAYSIFPNGGRKITPHLIELIQDRDGEMKYNADPRRCPACTRGFGGEESPRVGPVGAPVLDPITAYQITSMLEGVVQRGTAAQARSLGRPLAGKTGTTNDYRSAWFVGFSPDLVVGVFVGFDDNRSLGSGETGAVDAVPIFIDFMQENFKGKPVVAFKKPAGAKYVMVRGIEEAFRPGTEPRGPIGPAPGAPAGPQAYGDVWKNGEVTGAPSAAGAVAPAAGAPPPPKQPATKPPPKKKQPDDLNGLY